MYLQIVSLIGGRHLRSVYCRLPDLSDDSIRYCSQGSLPLHKAISTSTIRLVPAEFYGTVHVYTRNYGKSVDELLESKLLSHLSVP